LIRSTTSARVPATAACGAGEVVGQLGQAQPGIVGILICRRPGVAVRD
jgi:hypothetical protein